MTGDSGDKKVTEYVDLAETGIKALTPARNGWILGFVMAIAIMFISDLVITIRATEQARENSKNLTEYLNIIEANRADELRRAQEALRTLMDTMANQLRYNPMNMGQMPP